MKFKRICVLLCFFVFILPICSYANNIKQNKNIGVKANTNIRFVDNNNGTILDKKTGLLWKKCCEGQNGNECNNGELNVFTWEDAIKYAKNINNADGFAGNKKWRMPTLNELKTITDKSFNDPAIDLSIFPNTPSDYFWSSSSDIDNTDYAWGVNFCIGEDYNGGKQRLRYIRLVQKN